MVKTLYFTIYTIYIFLYIVVPDEKTGTLKLANLTSSMSGKYVCTAINTAGSESCFINLEVISCT